MAKQPRQGDHFSDARKYAGKNTVEYVGDGRGQDMGVKSVRPYVTPPNTRSFNDQWGRASHDHTAERPASGKKK